MAGREGRSPPFSNASAGRSGKARSRGGARQQEQ
ncbi:hypothetical protein AvCA_14200 [Azotobacter vinelandii CA]|uniref:Uncharacterized protein n=2 Tax=Azotobacter vinelandii TaxID=354 RepID=C1DQW3_AZOVD|nr:hypothetical protein Avin_14200 [Azotobacter vinelandii DJ]AGK15329.1 hypothetical protein AvCA_14200 [Azotobacter vinelandii CA]AGK19899.1 hypothetical protein AvCA6_14200 [Azotobacter vinelandii CA6]